MRNYFTFAGKDCREFNLYINGHRTFDSPEKDYSMIQVPGRNGDVAMDGNRLSNIELHYDSSFIFEDFEESFSNLKNFLLSQRGYQRLVDTYHPNEYRLAIFRKAIEPTMNESNEVGAFDLVFECQPQRYLLSGEVIDEMDVSDLRYAEPFSIENPTLFDSEPLIRVYGTGRVGIGEYTIVIDEADGYTDIDCHMMDCYKGNQNRNSYVTLSNHEFPVLKPGKNIVTMGTGISKVEITPRWWKV